jgi:hypothetical protein
MTGLACGAEDLVMAVHNDRGLHFKDHQFW